jgi:hypothetical protein
LPRDLALLLHSMNQAMSRWDPPASFRVCCR